MSSFAKNFLSTTITSFYTQVENFLKSKNFENLPPLSEFLNYIEFEAEAKIEEKKSKRSTAAPTRGKVSSDSKEYESEEKCSFVGSRGGKCKSVAKKDCNGLCKKHFEQSSDSKNNTDSERSAGAGDSDEKKSKSKSKSKTTVKTGKGLSSVVSKALEDSDREDEPEVKVQTRRTKPIEEQEENEEDEKEEKKEEKKSNAKKAKSSDDAEEKKSSRDTKSKTAKKDSKKKDEETKETKTSYAPITFNRDSTSFIYDENADDGFVYKVGDFNTVYAVRHRGVAVKPTRVHIEEIKKAGKTVGVIEDEDDSR